VPIWHLLPAAGSCALRACPRTPNRQPQLVFKAREPRWGPQGGPRGYRSDFRTVRPGCARARACCRTARVACARSMRVARGLVDVDADTLQLQVRVAVVRAGRVDAVLIDDDLRLSEKVNMTALEPTAPPLSVPCQDQQQHSSWCGSQSLRYPVARTKRVLARVAEQPPKAHRMYS
jgi:hypothetical protein